ncbi:unnamed protein product [Rangifer tarandus platyrhynchus]|uniref:Uncharacterized protein n=1 Tax=Rangifer tarandus platyrhynchus TaxID=3082113 RepID=A0ABN8Y134_RANTA|nr:unnamed protein product [Rangifer tarandus platyrhynchus]
MWGRVPSHVDAAQTCVLGEPVLLSHSSVLRTSGDMDCATITPQVARLEERVFAAGIIRQVFIEHLGRLTQRESMAFAGPQTTRCTGASDSGERSLDRSSLRARFTLDSSGEDLKVSGKPRPGEQDAQSGREIHVLFLSWPHPQNPVKNNTPAGLCKVQEQGISSALKTKIVLTSGHGPCRQALQRSYRAH